MIRNKQKKERGITLIALVVTIVVLLILAGVTITFVLGEGGILNMAKEAADKTKNAIANDQSDITSLAGDIQNLLSGDSGSGSTGETINPSTDTPPKIPEGLKVGSTVTYNPSGTYDWKSTYCSSTKPDSENVTLNSTSEGFNISEWKVLSIDKNTVELVPSKETTGTVYLGEAQGYNNAVKLLNEACSSLYGNAEKKIAARSIKIEDIEKYMTDKAKNSAYALPYDTQPYDGYTKENSFYPVIYARENKAVIDGETKSVVLGMSEQSNFIERAESTEEASVTDGKVQATTGIQPCQTYWKYDENLMPTAFKTYGDNTNNYYNLLIPNGMDTTYWIASRCVNAESNYSCFRVRCVWSGRMGAWDMFVSYDNTNKDSFALFPIVTLSPGLIKSDEGIFKVE